MRKLITSPEIIETVARVTGRPEEEVAKIIKAYAFEIHSQLNQQNAVEIEGLGFFRPAPKEEE